MDILETTIKVLINSKVKTLEELAKVKRKGSKICKKPCPKNISLLESYHKLVREGRIKPSYKIEALLRTRPVRSLSGIVNVSVLTKPYLCPGKCLFCPTEKGLPKSYISGEPAVERAKKLKYDPFLQTKKRIEMLETEGHPTDKIELRIVGGTWSFYPKKYQKKFIKNCFDAANGKGSKTLESSQRKNEKAKHRIVGLSIETRPDFITKTEIKRLRYFGVTMVELGVQSIYNDVLKINNRGHDIKATTQATKLLKDAGFKILYQIMPNLLGSNLKRDEKMFKELFHDQNFQPDYLKIYPCALLKSSGLYREWKKKKYSPYSEKSLIKLAEKIKKFIPFYVRIQRISRDIPSKYIISGPAKISNLRQILKEKMEKENWRCGCIRCREIKDRHTPKERLFLVKEAYNASDGKEIFLSFENKERDKLFSLLRLRITSENEAVIREVHTFGQLSPIKKKSIIATQHKGLGKKLIKEAEKIAKKEFGIKKISVISGVGVRGYYRRLGYKLKNTYMIKSL